MQGGLLNHTDGFSSNRKQHSLSNLHMGGVSSNYTHGPQLIQPHAVRLVKLHHQWMLACMHRGLTVRMIAGAKVRPIPPKLEIGSKMSQFGFSVSTAQPASFQGDVRCGASRNRYVRSDRQMDGRSSSHKQHGSFSHMESGSSNHTQHGSLSHMGGSSNTTQPSLLKHMYIGLSDQSVRKAAHRMQIPSGSTRGIDD